jgi:hypothetical protein
LRRTRGRRSSISEDSHFRGSQELRVETPEARREKSTVVIDLKGGYVSTDRGDLGMHVKGGEKAEREDRSQPLIIEHRQGQKIDGRVGLWGQNMLRL